MKRLAYPAAGAAVAVLVLALLLGGWVALLGGVGQQGSCVTGSPAQLQGVPARLRPIFEAASIKYRLGDRGPSILAALTEVESDFGRNMGPSSAGAIGWTQFMPATWKLYGLDANGDGRRDPFTAADAIFSSARYLRASGAPRDWYRALFAYNHANWYVRDVLRRADRFSMAAGSLVDNDASTFIVGDSLEVGTFPELQKLIGPGIAGDFKTGRPSRTGIEALRRALSHGHYGTILFDLGTNDASASELRRSLRDLGQLAGNRRVLVATVNSPWDQAAKNDLLRRFAASRPNTILIPWQRKSQSLGLPDGIHGGYPARARLIASVLSPGAEPAPAPECGMSVVPAMTGVRRVAGGGRIVPIPGQPGMSIDDRILPDVLFLIRTYHLTVTAGYSLSPVHKANGEHPLGLAVDLVPGPDGSWDDVDRLARWAEPVQNAPRPPFRWVGYNGDANHGRGNHLHLSWNHAPQPSRRPPVAWVDTFTLAQESL